MVYRGNIRGLSSLNRLASHSTVIYSVAYSATIDWINRTLGRSELVGASSHVCQMSKMASPRSLLSIPPGYAYFMRQWHPHTEKNRPFAAPSPLHQLLQLLGYNWNHNSAIHHVLLLRDRLRHIVLHLPPSILHKSLMFTDVPFSMLEHLSIAHNKSKHKLGPSEDVSDPQSIPLHAIRHWSPKKITDTHHCLSRHTRTHEHRIFLLLSP